MLIDKNIILIVGFCKTRYEQGDSLAITAVYTDMLRLHSILMTSLAFILEVISLMFTIGAGGTRPDKPLLHRILRDNINRSFDDLFHTSLVCVDYPPKP